MLVRKRVRQRDDKKLDELTCEASNIIINLQTKTSTKVNIIDNSIVLYKRKIERQEKILDRLAE